MSHSHSHNQLAIDSVATTLLQPEIVDVPDSIASAGGLASPITRDGRDAWARWFYRVNVRGVEAGRS
jgi:hypothetical protein